MKRTKLLIVVTFIMLTMYTKAQGSQTDGRDIYNTNRGNTGTGISDLKSKLGVGGTEPQKPNIILILADDVGYKSLTCNGGNLYSTPNIDELAKNGMRFTQCHATPTCSPSRYLLLTGKYNFRNYTQWGVMSPTEKTIGNMIKDAGYKTGWFGKDQLQGGGQSLNSWGFDEYCVHGPLDVILRGNPYKNPNLYTHGAFLPDSATLNKYGPDIVSDSILDFIDRNKSNPFFVYYPMMLVHQPISPTPDDSAFADTIWNDKKNYDTAFYPSMMHYMDKLIGKLVAELKSLGIEKNTVIIYCGDNGTATVVPDHSDGDSLVIGQKRKTNELGIHVPLIVYWPETIKAGTVNHDLIDFTDFMPTLAGIANTPTPANYGPLDGVSFFPRLNSKPGTPRDWLFYHYDSHPGISEPVRWAQTKTYKLYDTSSSNQSRLFYNIKNDVNEKFPIDDTLLTAQEAIIRQQLLDVINKYVMQGTPLISLNPSLSTITDSSVVLEDTINANGGSTITASGAVWSINPNPEISASDQTSTGKIQGPFSTLMKGLTVNTTYYIRAYATNFAGTAYSNQMIYKIIRAPLATKATGIDSNKFRANWNAYTDAAYRLDVSTSATFTRINASIKTDGFYNGITPPTGWTFNKKIKANTKTFAKASPSLEFTTVNAQVITKQLDGNATELSFWIKGLTTTQHSSLLVEGFDGSAWKVIANLNKLSTSGITVTFNSNSNPALEQNFIQFRFTFTKKPGTLVFDDVTIKYNSIVPFFIPGYNDLLVKTNLKAVTGLKAGTNYYYRVRAVQGTTSANSNVITAITKNVVPIHVADTVIANSSINTASGDLNARVFPNPSHAEFILTLQNSKNEKPEINVTDINGKELYRVTGRDNSKYIFGKTFPPGVYIVRVVQGKNIQTIKVIKGE